MRKMIFLAGLFLMIFSVARINAQIRIGGESAPDPSAVLDLNPDVAEAAGGFLLPRVRLTSKTDNVVFGVIPAEGLMVYNLNDGNNNRPEEGIYWYSNGKWHIIINADSLNVVTDRVSSLEAVTDKTSRLEKMVSQSNDCVLSQEALDSVTDMNMRPDKGLMVYNLNPSGDKAYPEEGVYFFTGTEWRIIPGTSASPVTFSIFGNYTDTTLFLENEDSLVVEVKANVPVKPDDIEYMWTLFDRDGKKEQPVIVRTNTSTLYLDHTPPPSDNNERKPNVLYIDDLEPDVSYNVSLAVSIKNQSRGTPSFVTTVVCKRGAEDE